MFSYPYCKYIRPDGNQDEQDVLVSCHLVEFPIGRNAISSNNKCLSVM